MNRNQEPPEGSGESRLRSLIEQIEHFTGSPHVSEPVTDQFPDLAHVDVQDLVIDGARGAIPARLYRGAASAKEVGLVWVHGGAFIAGDLDMAEAHWVSLELASRGVAVLSLEYDKALGGVHHPIPSDEILAGWLAATSDPDLLGIAAERLHLGGASAGANLSAGVALRLAAGAGPRPASLLLVYPILHAELPEPSLEAASAAAALPPDLRLDPDFVRAVNINYVGSPTLLGDPVAFPANGDLHGMPPTYIITAEADDLRSSGESFAAQLEAVGVVVRLELEPHTVHGFLDKPGLPGAVRTIDRLAGWLNGIAAHSSPADSA